MNEDCTVVVDQANEYACQDIRKTDLQSFTWNFIKFYFTFNSPQAKRKLISSIRNLIYELSQELLHDLRLTILGNKEILTKSKKLHGDTAYCPVFPALKKSTKTDIKVFQCDRTLLNFFNFSQNIL